MDKIVKKIKEQGENVDMIIGYRNLEVRLSRWRGMDSKITYHQWTIENMRIVVKEKIKAMIVNKR